MYVIGHVLKPQGVKGEIKVKSISSFPGRFKTLNKIYILKEKPHAFSIESVRLSGKFVFLKLSGINDREDSEHLRGCDILIDKSDLVELSNDEYFIHDLVGCSVVTGEGKELGELTEVSQLSSNDVYVVQNTAGDEILIPATKEVIRQVDVENKLITINLLEGLLD